MAAEPVTNAGLADAIAGLRREIQAGDQRIMDLVNAHVAAHSAEHRHIDTAFMRIDGKLDLLMERVSAASVHDARSDSRDQVLARLVMVSVGVMASVVTALILRAV